MMTSNRDMNGGASCHARPIHATRQRGASLAHVLAVAGTFCALSAVLFPRVATPEEMIQGEQALTIAATHADDQIWAIVRARASASLHHKLTSNRPLVIMASR